MSDGFLFKCGSYLVTAVIGVWLEALGIILPWMLVLVIAHLLDVFTAVRLQRRLQRAGLKVVGGGKYDSSKAFGIWGKLSIQFIFVLVVFVMQLMLFPTVEFQIARVVMALMICGVLLSVLEKEAACNDAKWAVLVSKLIKAKIEKYVDIDINELDKEDKNGNVDYDTNSNNRIDIH